jgi:hypothetical protein
MLEGRDLLFISTLDFGRVWGSREVYASHLAEKNRVFFVNPHYGPEQILRRRWIRELRREGNAAVLEVAPNLHVLTPPIALPGGRYNLSINGWNQDRLATWIHHVLAPFELDRPILWLYPPWTDRLVGRFNESLALYFCIDRFSSATEGLKKHVIDEGERRLARRVDLVIAITRHLESHLAEITAGGPPLHLVVNGAPIEEIMASRAQSEPTPSDLSGIPEPRLGFMGSLNAKVDLALVDKIARARPDWHWVFIGLVMEEELDRAVLSSLRSLSNIHLLGPKPRADIIAYERHFTVSTIPLLINKWSVNVLPLKFPEYLALGHPIISTRLPELSLFDDVTSFAATPDEWIAVLEREIPAATDPGGRARRLSRAKTLSWNSRVETVCNLIRSAEMSLSVSGARGVSIESN